MESLLLIHNRAERRIVICPVEGPLGSPRYAAMFSLRESNGSGVQSAATVDLESVSHQMEFVSTADLDIMQYSKLRERTVFGCLGVVGVSKVSHVGTVQGKKLYRIDAVEFISLSSSRMDSELRPRPMTTSGLSSLDDELARTSVSQSSHSMEVGRVLSEMVALISAGNFYFGYDWDATKCMQRTMLLGTGTPFSWKNCERSFFWNYSFMSPIIKYCRAHVVGEMLRSIHAGGIFVVCFQGMARVSHVQFGTLKCAFALISRVSCKRAGMRYKSRGINDDGHVSNFVETETLFAHPQYTFSYIIIRGTVPVFWEQQGFQLGYPRIQLTRTPVATQPAFDRHMANIHDSYGLIHVVDLLGQREGHAEHILSSAFRYHIRNSPIRRDISQTNFDIYSVCKNSNFSRLDSLFHMIGGDLQTFGYFVFDNQGQILREQKGVFRVNCLDCLDRTNMTQSYIVKRTLDLFVRNYLLVSGSSYNAESFQRHLAVLWDENGDQLSQIYTGSGAIKSSYGRLSKLTFKSFVEDVKNNAMRFYSNNFTEANRQEAIDVFLGKSLLNTPVGSLAAANAAEVNGTMISPAMDGLDQFETPKNLIVQLLTWNTNGTSPESKNDANFAMVSTPKGSPAPDIFAVSFQEIVELNASQIMSVDPEKRILWELALQRSLTERYPRQSYSLIIAQQLVGITLSVFIKSQYIDSVRKVAVSSLKVGMGGMAGNKGGVAIRLELCQKSICFVASHLPAGQFKAADRDRAADYLLSALEFPTGKQIMDHDVIMWMGDLNYRVEMERDEALELISNKQYERMLEHDQLLNRSLRSMSFKQFQEAPIKFAPTYKYDTGTNMYDTSEKMRVPSWTDRVLFYGQDVSCLYYDRGEIDISDHKPVKALIQIVLDESEFSDSSEEDVLPVTPDDSQQQRQSLDILDFESLKH